MRNIAGLAGCRARGLVAMRHCQPVPTAPVSYVALLHRLLTAHRELFRANSEIVRALRAPTPLAYRFFRAAARKKGPGLGARGL